MSTFWRFEVDWRPALDRAAKRNLLLKSELAWRTHVPKRVIPDGNCGADSASQLSNQEEYAFRNVSCEESGPLR